MDKYSARRRDLLTEFLAEARSTFTALTSADRAPVYRISGEIEFVQPNTVTITDCCILDRDEATVSGSAHFARQALAPSILYPNKPWSAAAERLLLACGATHAVTHEMSTAVGSPAAMFPRGKQLATVAFTLRIDTAATSCRTLPFPRSSPRPVGTRYARPPPGVGRPPRYSTRRRGFEKTTSNCTRPTRRPFVKQPKFDRPVHHDLAGACSRSPGSLYAGKTPGTPVQ